MLHFALQAANEQCELLRESTINEINFVITCQGKSTILCYQHYTPLDIDLISYNNFPLCLGYGGGGGLPLD